MSGGGDLAARVRAAKAIREQAEQRLRAQGREETDWEAEARRLSAVIATLVAILEEPSPAITLSLPDGSAFLSRADSRLIQRLGNSLMGGEFLAKEDTAGLLRLARELGAR